MLEDLPAVLTELSDEERNNYNNEDYFDLPDNSVNEPERKDILHDNHSCDSEQSADDRDKPTVSMNEDFQIFMGQGKQKPKPTKNITWPKSRPTAFQLRRYIYL